MSHIILFICMLWLFCWKLNIYYETVPMEIKFSLSSVCCVYSKLLLRARGVHLSWVPNIFLIHYFLLSMITEVSLHHLQIKIPLTAKSWNKNEGRGREGGSPLSSLCKLALQRRRTFLLPASARLALSAGFTMRSSVVAFTLVSLSYHSFSPQPQVVYCR